MLLQKLRDLSTRLDLPPAMYVETPIRWLIDLEKDGTVMGLVPTEGDSPRGKRFLAPHIQRSSGVRAKLLADNGEYVLAVPRDPEKAERVERCHEALVELVQHCAEATGEPAVVAVRRFLEGLEREALELPEEFNPADTLTFRVGGDLPIHLPAVQEWWAGFTAETPSGNVVELECLVCGELKPVERRLPFKLKGIPGGQFSGTALVSANASAFESYGLEASLISPICRECGEAFAQAANRLLADQAHHLRVGSTVYVFWTRSGGDYSIVDFLKQPTPGQVRELLSSVWSGREGAVELDDEPFYAVALTASGGRVVVRDWIDTTVALARASLARWFRLQRLADPEAPDEPRSYGVLQLAGSTVRDLNDLRSEVVSRLVAVALKGGAIPDRLLFEAVRRNRADQQVTRPRVALVKSVLLSHEPPELEETMVKLEPGNRDPAYLCGRLFALLEDVQRAAIPGAKATLVDRFFGSASAAPASVFGTLLRNAQAHLGKLRKEKRGAYEALEQRLEEVSRELEGFPRTLNMRQQALFSLGYYHQRAQRRADMAAAQAARKATDAQAS